MWNKIKYALWYVKLNLLWLFKYRCQIPVGVWFCYGRIEQGTLLIYHNQRLHIVRPVDASCHASPIGIALHDAKKGDDLAILNRGVVSGLNAINDMYIGYDDNAET